MGFSITRAHSLPDGPCTIFRRQSNIAVGRAHNGRLSRCHGDERRPRVLSIHPILQLQERGPVRFILVHGGFHGAWCWDKMVPQLERLGHEVLAIDLPGSGERMEEEATHASWRAAFREVVEGGDVLVGHSQGGFAISLAADELPEKVGRLVYLSAAVPIEGEAMGAATSGSTERWPATIGLPLEDFSSWSTFPDRDRASRSPIQKRPTSSFITTAFRATRPGPFPISLPCRSARPLSHSSCPGSGPRASPVTTSSAPTTTPTPSLRTTSSCAVWD